MPNYTENYNLEKPLPNENYNVEVFNNNADIIDQKLKEIEDSVENIEVPVISVNGKTGNVELTASDVGAETLYGAQAKADQAESNAKAYADNIKPTKVSQLENDKGYITSQRPVSDSVSSTSSSIAASSKAVKTAYDKAVQALNTANTYTANDVLDKLKTVDGVGSGIDADLLDGKHASAFASSTHEHVASDITGLVTANFATVEYIGDDSLERVINVGFPVKSMVVIAEHTGNDGSATLWFIDLVNQTAYKVNADDAYSVDHTEYNIWNHRHPVQVSNGFKVSTHADFNNSYLRYKITCWG